MSDVTAVIVGASTPETPPGAAAVMAVPALADVVDAARAAATPLVWILDAGATAGERTLPLLLDAGRLPAASLPVDESGQPLEPWIGTIADSDVPGLLLSIQANVVPLRFTPVQSLLAERELLLEEPGPAAGLGPYAGIEWTARLFARRPAILVPASTVTVRARRYPFDAAALGRVVRNPQMRTTDALRQLRLAVETRRGG